MLLVAYVALLSGCQAPASNATIDAPAHPSEDAVAPATDTLPLEAARIPAAAGDPDRWLFVEKARDGAAGGWATGSFIADRNKLDIETRDVQRFAVDTSRILIDWERLVVLSINGVNSELRRRDYDILHFGLDEHNQWVVIEP